MKREEVELCTLCKTPMKQDYRVKNGRLYRCTKCKTIVTYPSDYDERVEK